MSTVLIKQYKASDNQPAQNEKLQEEFAEHGLNAVIVPTDLSIEMITKLSDFGIGKNIAVIKLYGDTESLRENALKFKADLLEVDIRAIILPADTSIEILP